MGFLYLEINVSKHYWKLYPVQVKIRLHQLRNVIKI